jgi:hypothetical protein
MAVLLHFSSGTTGKATILRDYCWTLKFTPGFNLISRRYQYHQHTREKYVSHPGQPAAHTWRNLKTLK